MGSGRPSETFQSHILIYRWTKGISPFNPSRAILSLQQPDWAPCLFHWADEVIFFYN